MVKAVAQHLWNDRMTRHDALHYFAMLPEDPEALQLLARVAEARSWCLYHVEVVVGLEWPRAGSSSCLVRWGVRFAGTPGVYLADSGVAELSDRAWDSLSIDSMPETRLRWLLERTPGAQCQLYASTLRAGDHGLADMEAFMKYEALKSIIGEEIDDRHGYRVGMPAIEDLVAALQGVRLSNELISLHNAWKVIEFIHDSVYVGAMRGGGADHAVDVLLTGTRLDMARMLVEPAAGVRIRGLADDMLDAWLAARHLFHKVLFV